MFENMRILHNDNSNEQGNVLFLILIAVALFAAPSYAITSSTRSGGGSADNETNLLHSAGIIQYPASVQTAIARMRLTDNIRAEDLEFYPPSNLASCSDAKKCVFHPQGGGATWSDAPADVMTGVNLNPERRWHYTGAFEFDGIGTSLVLVATATISSRSWWV